MGATGTGQPFVPPDDIVQKRWNEIIDADRVTLVDASGNIIDANHPLATTTNIAISGDIEIGAVEIKDGITDKRAEVTVDGALTVRTLNELIPFKYDFINLSYDVNSNITQTVFKTGGSGGTAVATLNMTYDVDNNLSTVTRI